MSTTVHLDSTFRDRAAYTNPAQYTLSPDDVAAWSSRPIITRATAGDRRQIPADMVKSVNVASVTTPYVASLVGEPVLYLELYTLDHRSDGMINTIGGQNGRARFVLRQNRIQVDSLGAPVWIHWYAEGERVYPFSFRQPITVRIFQRTGATIPLTDAAASSPPDLSRQTLITLQVMPYTRDADYVDRYTDYTE